MIDLREAANEFLHGYGNKDFLESIIPRNRQTCISLDEKLNTLAEDLKQQKSSSRTTWNENTWTEIISIQKNLSELLMSKLIVYFTSIDQLVTKLEVLKIMEDTRKNLKLLWTKAIKNILYTGGA